MAAKDVKRLVKPLYLVLFDIINKIYFNNYISSVKRGARNNILISKSIPGNNILILAPHVDDDVIGCGGAILKCLKEGKNIYIAYLTDGKKRGSKNNEDDIIKERRQEAFSIAKKVGINEDNLYFLNGEDGDLINSDIKNDLLNIVANIKPDTIFMPCLLDTHADHYSVTHKLFEIYDESKELLEEVNLFLYEAQSPLTFEYANVFLDITDEFSLKKELTQMYPSQGPDFKFIEDLNRINGKAFGDKIVSEAFLKCSVKKYYELYKNYYNDFNKFLLLKAKLVANGDSRDLIKSYKSSLQHKTLLKELQDTAKVK